MTNPLISTWPRLLVQVAFNAGGNSTGPSHWYTLSDRLRGSWSIDLAGRQYETDAIESGSFDFSVDNLNGDFDPDNSSGFFYPYVLPYRRCRVVMVPSPSANLLYQWMSNGTSALSQAASAGSLSASSGLPVSPSGLTTAITWSLPNGAASGAVYGLTGATQSWLTADNNGITATPGLPYSVGVDLSIASGGMSSLGVQVQVAFYSLTGTLLGGAHSATTSITTTSQRLTVTGTAPAGAAFVIPVVVTQAATTAATTIRATGWQLEQSASPTAWAYPGNWNQIWQGFVESWKQHYDQGGKYGLCDVECVDALAPLSQLTMGYVMPEVVSATNPRHSFPLSGSKTSFVDPTGMTLAVVGPKLATGTSISSTDDIGTLWNTPGPVVTFSSSQAASLGEAAGATYLKASTVMLPSSGAWTRTICFRTDLIPGQNSTYSTATLWCASKPGFNNQTGDKSGFQLAIDSNGHLLVTYENATGSANDSWANPTFVCDGNWHCASVGLSADGKVVTLSVDGIGFELTEANDVHGSYDLDVFGSSQDSSGLSYAPFSGDMAWIIQWSSTLSTSDIENGFSNGWAGESNTARTQRIINYSNFNPGGYTATRFVGSNANMGGVSIQDRSPMDILQESADTESGQFTVDRNGVLTMYGQLWRWIQTQPKVTFGENVTAGEVPYLGDVVFEQDPARLFNDIQITIDGAVDQTDSNANQEVQDLTSQNNYFPQTLQRNVNPQYVQGGLNVGNYLLSQFKDPHTRLESLTVDLASNPSNLTAVVGIGFGDRVRAMKRPPGAPAKQLDCYVERILWSGDDTGSLQLQTQMSPAGSQYGLISATWAPLTTSSAAGASTITVGALNGLSLTGAQYVIPPNYQMTLGFGTANSETVTIQSVQTVSPGYTSVQLTLSSPTTKSHAANDLICDIEPNGITLPPVGSYPKCFDAASLTGGTTPLIGF